MDAVCNQDNKKLHAMLAARDEEPRARKRIPFLAAWGDSAGIKATENFPIAVGCTPFEDGGCDDRDSAACVVEGVVKI